MSLKKVLISAMIPVLAAGILASCASRTANESTAESVSQSVSKTETIPENTATVKTLRVLALKGPTGMGLASLMDKASAKSSEGMYEFQTVASPDEIVAKVLKNDSDVFAMPANMAAVLSSKTQGKFRVLAVNTLGVLSIMSKEDTIKTFADLKGKTIAASGKGATPEYILNYLLKKNGLDPEKDVTVEWKSEHAEVVSALAAGKADAGLLPQPFATVAATKIEGLKKAIDFNEEWDKTGNGSKLVMGVIGARSEFIDKNADLIDTFLKEYRSSVDMVNQDPSAAGELVAKYGILDNAKIAAKAIPQCNITLITGKDMKSSLEGFLKIMSEADPKSVGGKLPDDNFYYER